MMCTIDGKLCATDSMNPEALHKQSRPCVLATLHFIAIVESDIVLLAAKSFFLDSRASLAFTMAARC